MGDWSGRLGGAIHRVESFFDRLVLGWKWRTGRWKELSVRPYAGWVDHAGTIHLKARVLDDRRPEHTEDPSIWRSIAFTVRSIETDDVPGALVRLTLDGHHAESRTDGDGYCDFSLTAPFEAHDARVTVRLEVIEPRPRDGRRPAADGVVFVPDADAEYLVVSDIDDTIVHTGAVNPLQSARVVLFNDARTRVPFRGVAELYRALVLGPDRRGRNPLFYITSSPWNLYEHLHGFMKAHEVPPGPLLMKDFGFSPGKLLKSGHEEHKLEGIRRLLEAYPELPAILIGDSGQKDPEIYRQVAGEHPGRIRVIYVRDVTPDERDAEVRAIAEESERAGAPMVLVSDTLAATRDAVERGLVHPDALEDVRRACEAERELTSPGPIARLLGAR